MTSHNLDAGADMPDTSDEGIHQDLENPPDQDTDMGPRIKSGDCPPPCTMNVQAVRDATSVSFDRAHFGFNPERQSIWLEVYSGVAPGCPTQTSPDPQALLLLPSLRWSEDPSTSPSLFDFADAFQSDAPIIRAVDSDLAWVAFDLCPRCEGEDLEGFVALDARITLEEDILVEGRIVATHCASLDSDE